MVLLWFIIKNIVEILQVEILYTSYLRYGRGMRWVCKSAIQG